MDRQISDFNESGTIVENPGRGMMLLILLAALAVVVTSAVIAIDGLSSAAAAVETELPAQAAPHLADPYWFHAREFMAGDISDALDCMALAGRYCKPPP